MVVDDSVVFRKVLSDLLGTLPGVCVIGNASNGQIALDKLARLQPDALTLDIEMPVLDGMETLRLLRQQRPEIDVVMVSAASSAGAQITIDALSIGAVDFIAKPASEGKLGGGQEMLLAQLRPVIAALVARKASRHARQDQRGDTPAATGRSGFLPALPSPWAAPSPARPASAAPASARPSPAAPKPDIVAFGVSTGGPPALGNVIPRLPGTLGVPVLIVQHMPELFTKQLARSLDQKSALRVVEAEDQQPVEDDTVYLAPGGHHMKVVRDVRSSRVVLRITDDPPERHCKPSVDYLFRSLARVHPGRVLPVILTGMGDDGTMGLRLLKRHPAIALAQDEQSSTVFGMPRAAIESGLVDEVLPLAQIAERIVTILRGKA